jgi:hypothetical protein
MKSPNPAPIANPTLQTRRRTIRSGLQRTGATLSLALALVAGGIAVAPPASADQIGQAPTAANITGNGSFAVSSSTVTGQSGFGGGTVYYPNATGVYPVVAIVPGFLNTWSNVQWLGPRLSSWGFVVVGINTNGIFDLPGPRGDQLLAALNWAVNSAPTDDTRALAHRQDLGTGHRARAHHRGPERHNRTARLAFDPLLQHPCRAQELCGARRGQPPLPMEQQRHSLTGFGLLVQALAEQRHPVHAVHLWVHRQPGLGLQLHRLLEAYGVTG